MGMDDFVYNTVPEVRDGTCTNLRAANIVTCVTAVKLRQGGVKRLVCGTRHKHLQLGGTLRRH